SRLGYRVILACDGEEAERMFRQNCEQIDLILMDLFMPKLIGTEVYKRICEIKPGVQVIFTTGHSAGSGLPNSPAEDRTLQKPYTSRMLAQRVRRLLDGRSA
ncbi:MAG: response regulator, partial [Acidobacteriales bacterium]|nr:response regulator [Terriglobales bacterium]